MLPLADGMKLSMPARVVRDQHGNGPDMQPVTITLVFQATAEQLFCAWTDPDVVSKWLFRGDDSVIESVEMDVAVGGRFSILERNDDMTTDHFGNYLLVEKPNLLSFTLEVPKHFPGQTQVQLEFRQFADGCEMIFQQTGVDAEIVEAGWRRMFTKLAQLLLEDEIARA